MRFCSSFPFVPIAYTPCAVIFGQVLASWNPKKLELLRRDSERSWTISFGVRSDQALWLGKA